MNACAISSIEMYVNQIKGIYNINNVLIKLVTLLNIFG